MARQNEPIPNVHVFVQDVLDGIVVAVYSQHAGLNTMCVIAQLRCRSWRQTPLPELFGEKAIPCDLPELSRTLLFDFENNIHNTLISPARNVRKSTVLLA
jgi:hypothetical protein